MTQAKFKIGGIEYAFNEITLRAYYTIQEIAKKGKQKKQDEFEIVEAITNCPVKELKKLSYQDWLIIWEEALFRINSISGGTEDIKPMFELKGVTYALPDVDKISIGEFADLEIILASPNSSTRLNEVAAVLYRKVVKKIGKKHIIEDYDTDGFNERSELFLDMPLSGIRSANAFFFAFRATIFKEYHGIFNEDDGGDEIPTPREKARNGKDPNRTARVWWATINTLAGSDPLRFDESSKLPVRAAFNWIAWKKDEYRKQVYESQKQTNKIK
jgi:hypothetical protein